MFYIQRSLFFFPPTRILPPETILVGPVKKDLSAFQNSVLNLLSLFRGAPASSNQKFHPISKICALKQPRLGCLISNFCNWENPFSNLNLNLGHSDTQEVLGSFLYRLLLAGANDWFGLWWHLVSAPWVSPQYPSKDYTTMVWCEVTSFILAAFSPNFTLPSFGQSNP